MTPEAKFQALVTSITVSIMYLFITKLLPELKALDFLFGKELATILSAVGLYKLLALVVGWLAKKCNWLMSKLLGPYYVGGTWICFAKTKTGKSRIIVEHYEQTLTDLVIRGNSYKINGTLDATCYTHTAQIDPLKGTLHCFYAVNVLRKHYIVESLGFLQFDRKNSDASPQRMVGYSLDTDAGFELHRYQNDEALVAAPKVNLNENSGKIIFEEFYKCSTDLLSFQDGLVAALDYFAKKIEDSEGL